MDPISHKLQHRTEEEVEHGQESTSRQEQSGHSFEEVEDLLRYDAAQVPLPAGIEERLRESLAAVPPVRKHWWNRLFRG